MRASSGTVERAVDKVLRFSPAQPLFRWHAARHLTVLAYHAVSDAETLAAQMSVLRRLAHPVSANEVRTALGTGRSLPRGAVLVTFDDGDRTILDVALPVLERFDVQAVAFVVADILDKDTPLWWQEVSALLTGLAGTAATAVDTDAEIRRLKQLPNAERLTAIAGWRRESKLPAPRILQLRREELAVLERGGIEIGNHSCTHPCVDQCDDATLEQEIVGAHRILTDAVGHAPQFFAYPNGNFDRRVPPILHQLGYTAAFLFDHRICHFPPSEPFAMSRVRVNSTTSVDRFRTIISGLHPAIHRARFWG